tara:strand:+ start:2063 stop:2311 length:249 start_codon:yes stop_codon:yes gene_type:complete
MLHALGGAITQSSQRDAGKARFLRNVRDGPTIENGLNVHGRSLPTRGQIRQEKIKKCCAAPENVEDSRVRRAWCQPLNTRQT